MGYNTGRSHTVQEGDLNVDVAVFKVWSSDDGDGK